MADINHIFLPSCLQETLSAIRSYLQVHEHSSFDPAYGPDDIQSTIVWHDFNLNAILQRYHHVLTQASIRVDPMPMSPPPPIACSNSLRWRLWDNVFPRIRRSLRAGFSYLAEAGPGSMDGISPVIFDDERAARDIDGYRPAIAYHEAALIFGTGPNRAPGDVQIPWEWNTGFTTHPDPDMRDKYRQGLSKVN